MGANTCLNCGKRMAQTAVYCSNKCEKESIYKQTASTQIPTRSD